MGYCSYVALCVSPVGETDLLKEYSAAIAGLEPEEQDDLTSLVMEPDHKLENEGSVLRIWEATKWYVEERASVKFIDSFVDEHFHDARLLRYGENEDDAEITGGYDDNPFQIRIERRFRFKGDGARRASFSHMILCLSQTGERRFQDMVKTALNSLPEELRQLREVYIRACEIRIDDTVIRSVNLNDPSFSGWLCDFVSQLQENLAVTEYYLIKLHPDPQQRIEEGSLYRLAKGVPVSEPDSTQTRHGRRFETWDATSSTL
ncbi:hypothetical protein LJB81_01365 [Desulfovibrio sp. OttesenSCG-928-M14]|nr:hypothetical protein [Desulfovibrio sp. OttesenSCG-928-M14]